jgi:hypothetical protein
MAEALMELEVAAKMGADPHEPTRDRAGHRNGHRARHWDTRAGTIELDVPVRPGSAAGRTRCEASGPRPQGALRASSPPTPGRSSCSPTGRRRTTSSARSSTSSGLASRRRPRCSSGPRTMCSPRSRCPANTGRRPGRPTRSSGSTARSPGGPSWSGSSRTARRSFGSPALLAEQHNEWLTADRRYLTGGSLTRLLGSIRNPTLGELLKERAAV